MHTIKVELNDEKTLLDAIKEMGYTAEVHENLVDMQAWGSQKRKAHIIVRKNAFGGMADIGFERQTDGTYIMHADDYDWGKHGKRFNFDKMKQLYTKIRIKKHVTTTSKYSIVSETVDEGKIKLRIRLQQY